tara:strand:+ start:3853 stop:4443 length:591 start_codon:yes stop_codon:yes gene_type:complete
MYRAEYDTRLLYSQSYTADEGLFVSTDCYAVMWTYPQAVSPTTTRVRLTYIYTKEGGGISPVQGIMEQWKSEGWTVMDEFCDGYSDFSTAEELRDQMMQMVRSFLLGVPVGAEVEGDSSPKPGTPNKTGFKKPSALKSRIEKLIKKPVPTESGDAESPDEDDIFASARIIKVVKPLKPSGSKADKPDDDDDDDTWI